MIPQGKTLVALWFIYVYWLQIYFIAAQLNGVTNVQGVNQN